MASDPHSRRIALLRQVADLETQFKRLIAEKKTCLDKSCLMARESLQRGYEQAVINDWYVEDHDGESQMWKICFYKPIEEWRRKIRSFSQVISEAQGKNDAKRVQASLQEQAKTSALFHAFLETSTGFYHNLLAKIRAKYGISIERCALMNVTDTKSAAYRYHMTVLRILIRLGDLARYQRDLVGFPDADWLASWSYYMDAQRMIPEQGMPYNQLAVLCTYSQDSIGALYYYARSLALKAPSETGKANIDVLMRDASITKYLEARRKHFEVTNAPKRARVIGDGQSANVANSATNGTSQLTGDGKTLTDLWSVFVLGFFGLHNADNALALERVQESSDMLLEDFETLVKRDFVPLHKPSSVPGPSGSLASSTYLQLMVYNIFAAWSILSQLTASEGPSSAETRTLLLQRLNLVVQMSFAMLTVLIDRAVLDFPSTLPNASSQRMEESHSNESVLPPPALASASFAASAPTTAASSAIGKLEIMPVISVFLQWLTVVPSSRLVSYDYTSVQEQMRFTHLQKSLSTLLHATLPHARRYQEAIEKYPSRAIVPLPEDCELYPFLPLAPAYQDISFRALSTAHDSDEAFARRCHRVAQFAERASTEPALISATREALQDPVTYFAFHVLPGGAHLAGTPSATFSPQTEIPLFSHAQAVAIHHCFAVSTISDTSTSNRQVSAASVTGAPSSSATSSSSASSKLSPKHAPIEESRPFVITRSFGSEEEEVETDGHSEEMLLHHHHVPSSASKLSQHHVSAVPGSLAAFDQLADAMDLDSVSESASQGHSSQVSGGDARVPIVAATTVAPAAHIAPLIQPHHVAIENPLRRHPSSSSVIGPPRVLFQEGVFESDSIPQDDAQGANAMALDVIGSPMPGIISSTSPDIQPTSSKMVVTPTPLPPAKNVMLPDATGLATSGSHSAYDPWARFPIDASGSASHSLNDLHPPTLMSNGGPTWNPFLLTSGEALQLPPLGNPLSAALLGQSTHLQDQQRPLLFPGTHNTQNIPISSSLPQP